MAISSVLKAGTFSALVYRRSYLPAKKGGKMGVYRLRTYMTKTSKEPFLNGSSSTYVEEMYKAWLKNPESVHKVSCEVEIEQNNFSKKISVTFHSEDDCN